MTKDLDIAIAARFAKYDRLFDEGAVLALTRRCRQLEAELADVRERLEGTGAELSKRQMGAFRAALGAK